jgi:hypothetical protein
VALLQQLWRCTAAFLRQSLFEPYILNFHLNVFLSLLSTTIKDRGCVSVMAAPLPKHTISSSVITKYKHDAAVFVDRDDQQCIEIGPGSVCFFEALTMET